MVWGLELDKQALIEISLNFAYLTIDYRFVVLARTSDPVLNWDPSILHYVWNMVWTLLVFLRSVARGAQCECKPDGTTYIRWDSTY